jgi:hypothetical protein
MSASKLLTHLLTHLLNWAGLWFAALVWAVNMQLGQILPYSDCRSQIHASAIASFAGAALAVVSGLTSWQYSRRIGGDAVARDSTAHFGSVVSALSATLFTFALLMQGVASLVLSGCER